MPDKGETVYCRQCQDYRTVERAVNFHRVMCGMCRFNGRFGQDLDAARRSASRHVTRFGDHVVSIWRDAEVIETVSQNTGQGQLPFQSVVDSRCAMVTDHQKRLRDLVTKPLPNRDQSHIDIPPY